MQVKSLKKPAEPAKRCVTCKVRKAVAEFLSRKYFESSFNRISTQQPSSLLPMAKAGGPVGNSKLAGKFSTISSLKPSSKPSKVSKPVRGRLNGAKPSLSAEFIVDSDSDGELEPPKVTASKPPKPSPIKAKPSIPPPAHAKPLVSKKQPVQQKPLSKPPVPSDSESSEESGSEESSSDDSHLEKSSSGQVNAAKSGSDSGSGSDSSEEDEDKSNDSDDGSSKSSSPSTPPPHKYVYLLAL
jgi:hypothetical protein